MSEERKDTSSQGRVKFIRAYEFAGQFMHLFEVNGKPVCLSLQRSNMCDDKLCSGSVDAAYYVGNIKRNAWGPDYYEPETDPVTGRQKPLTGEDKEALGLYLQGLQCANAKRPPNSARLVVAGSQSRLSRE